MTSYEKEMLLEQYIDYPQLTKKHFKIIKAYAHDKDVFVRIQVAKVLINFNDYILSKKILFELMNDNEELVRINAYDSLSVFDSKDVERLLKKAIKKERRELACAYAITSWAEVVTLRRKIVWKQYFFIHNLKKKNRIRTSERCLLKCCYAHYIFGRKKALKEILSFLKSSDYHIRCATLNTLQYIIDSKNISSIKKEVETLLLQEDSRAVRTTAQKLLDIDVDTCE